MNNLKVFLPQSGNAASSASDWWCRCCWKWKLNYKFVTAVIDFLPWHWLKNGILGYKLKPLPVHKLVILDKIKMGVAIKINSHLLAPSINLKLFGKLVLNLTFGLGASRFGCKTPSWRLACCCPGSESLSFGDPSKSNYGGSGFIKTDLIKGGQF